MRSIALRELQEWAVLISKVGQLWTSSSLTVEPKQRVSKVLDASAMLAFVLNEPGLERVVGAFFEGALISSVNLAEVASRLIDLGHATGDIPGMISLPNMSVVPFDAANALAAANLRPSTRAFGLSLGDRACLALAASVGAPALTADRLWSQLDIGVAIEVIR
jgi:PIN domain nuclease of toxin-antitoxin system